MDSRSELIFENGLPKERSFTDAEILAMEDRLATSYETPEPPSDPLTSEPSSGDIFQPPSDGNLPRVKSDSVDLVYKRQAVAYWKSGAKKRLSFSNVHHRFKKLKSMGMLEHWARQISPDSRSEKLRMIFQKTLEQYDKVNCID